MKPPNPQLLPDQPYTIWIADGDGSEFIRMFRSVWAALPTSVQTRIIEHWQTEPTRQEPYFELSECWAPATSSAQVKMTGFQMKFRTSSFRHFPEPAARWVIAHELAHVWQWVIGRNRLDFTVEENEDDADRIAEGWGFCHLCRMRIQVEINYGKSFEAACDFVRSEPWCRSN